MQCLGDVSLELFVVALQSALTEAFCDSGQTSTDQNCTA